MEQQKDRVSLFLDISKYLENSYRDEYQTLLEKQKQLQVFLEENKIKKHELESSKKLFTDRNEKIHNKFSPLQSKQKGQTEKLEQIENQISDLLGQRVKLEYELQEVKQRISAVLEMLKNLEQASSIVNEMQIELQDLRGKIGEKGVETKICNKKERPETKKDTKELETAELEKNSVQEKIGSEENTQLTQEPQEQETTAKKQTTLQKEDKTAVNIISEIPLEELQELKVEDLQEKFRTKRIEKNIIAKLELIEHIIDNDRMRAKIEIQKVLSQLKD